MLNRYTFNLTIDTVIKNFHKLHKNTLKIHSILVINLYFLVLYIPSIGTIGDNKKLQRQRIFSLKFFSSFQAISLTPFVFFFITPFYATFTSTFITFAILRPRCISHNLAVYFRVLSSLTTSVCHFMRPGHNKARPTRSSNKINLRILFACWTFI